MEFTIDDYLKLCQEDIELEEYCKLEGKRQSRLKKVKSSEWISIIKGQRMECYYCKTDLRIIQQLILNKIINPRKRGTAGYSGIHFELDHKIPNRCNDRDNIVAACYYCNNDKSNTISYDIFISYFAIHRKNAFTKLFTDKKLKTSEHYRHNLKGELHNKLIK